MQITTTAIPDILEVTPSVFGDSRGFFMETWNEQRFLENGIDTHFVQDNHSLSSQGTLRGLHYQSENPQGKLVRVTRGQVFDVAVDMRKASPTFGKWVGVTLCAEAKNMLWVPPGFAHGFYVLSKEAEFLYKCSDIYNPAHEHCLHWNDPTIAIDWPLLPGTNPLLSEKDAAGKSFDQAFTYADLG